MSGRPHMFRRQHFIKKGFQLNFSIRFLVLIAIEAILLGGLFWYMSQNTLTTGYVDAQLRIENTSSFFYPSMMVSNLLVVLIVGIIGLVGLIFISHKIAGPLYRFESSLKEISGGDLTHRIRTRKKDQLKDLADSLNEFTSSIDGKVHSMQQSTQDAVRLASEVQHQISTSDKIDAAMLEDLSKTLNALQSALYDFKTTQGSDSRGREG